MESILFGVGGVLLGAAFGYIIRQFLAEHRKNSVEAKLKKLVEDSKVEAKEMLLEAKEKAAKTLEEAKHEEKDRIQQLRRLEERLIERETSIDRRVQESERKSKELEERIERVKTIKTEIEESKAKVVKEIERVSGLSKEDAIGEVMNKVEKDYTQDLMVRVKKLEQTGMEDLERKAKNILTAIIQRLATSTTSEIATTTVSIPSDDLKGKIIGREGRNIKTLERAAGVEIIVDDTPGSIVISCFDPVRRQIAKIALEILIQDGRIQPARIEETVEKAREEIEKRVREAGEKAAYELIKGTFP